MIERLRNDLSAADAFVRSPAGRPWLATIAGYAVAIALLFALLFVVPLVLVGL